MKTLTSGERSILNLIDRSRDQRVFVSGQVVKGHLLTADGTGVFTYVAEGNARSLRNLYRAGLVTMTQDVVLMTNVYSRV